MSTRIVINNWYFRLTSRYRLQHQRTNPHRKSLPDKAFRFKCNALGWAELLRNGQSVTQSVSHSVTQSLSHSVSQSWPRAPLWLPIRF